MSFVCIIAFHLGKNTFIRPGGGMEEGRGDPLPFKFSLKASPHSSLNFEKKVPMGLFKITFEIFTNLKSSFDKNFDPPLKILLTQPVVPPIIFYRAYVSMKKCLSLKLSLIDVQSRPTAKFSYLVKKRREKIIISKN